MKLSVGLCDDFHADASGPRPRSLNVVLPSSVGAMGQARLTLSRGRDSFQNRGRGRVRGRFGCGYAVLGAM
jgi:hypothetical protein